MDALAVIENALSGLSSDLGIEVRDKRGLAYFTGAFNRPGLQPGLFALYAGVREDTADETEKLIDAETARIAAAGLREEEFQRAREQIIAGFEMSLQNNGELAQTCALNELYGLGYGYGLSIKKRMEALTAEAIREAAASVFHENRRAVSLVLPGQRGEEESK
jgi:zinc protease